MLKKREKLFGMPASIPLDRNAKARITAYAKAYTARHRQPGQHTGPLTRAYMDVLKALLWAFHNARTGICFPSYEAIAERASCHRDTVRLAVAALERAGVLTWAHRLRRAGGRVLRTSNGYIMRDPAPGQTGPNPPKSSKTENPPGTPNQVFSNTYEQIKIVVLDPRDPLDAALIRLGKGAGALEVAGA